MEDSIKKESDDLRELLSRLTSTMQMNACAHTREEFEAAYNMVDYLLGWESGTSHQIVDGERQGTLEQYNRVKCDYKNLWNSLVESQAL